MNADALSCSACRGALAEYVAGLCAPQVRLRIAAHLDECSACRDEMRQWTGIVSGLRKPQPRDEPPPG